MNLILCGFMGCGKTTVGRLLAQKTGYAFKDTDALIEEEQGQTISRIFDTFGEAYFRDLEHEICRRLGGTDGMVISTGGGALTFERNVQALQKNGKIIFLDVPFETLKKRAGSDPARPLFQDGEKAKLLYEKRYPLYLKAADVLINGGLSPEQTAAAILKQLNKMGETV